MKIRCQTDVKMTAWRYKILNSLLTSGRCRFDVGFSSPRLCCHHDYTAHQGICEGGVRFFQPCETEVEKINVRLTGEVEKNCDSQGGWTISGVSQWGRNFFRGRTTPQPVIKEHSLQYHWYVFFLNIYVNKIYEWIGWTSWMWLTLNAYISICRLTALSRLGVSILFNQSASWRLLMRKIGIKAIQWKGRWTFGYVYLL